VAGILQPEQLHRLRGLRFQQLENGRTTAGRCTFTVLSGSRAGSVRTPLMGGSGS